MQQEPRWTKEKINHLIALPFLRLLHQAQGVHQAHFDAEEIEFCTLLSIKTGACPEDCAYCTQSAHYDTGLTTEKVYDTETVLQHARVAKANGATRFCMGAAWRQPPKKYFGAMLTLVKEVRAIGLETCMTLGMLTEDQAQQLKEAGLDYYNHNLDTSPEYYKKIITTRTYQDRITTLNHVHNAGIHVCCGGIMGMGEDRNDRIEFLLQLAALPLPPASIPINQLIPIPGTPLADSAEIDSFEFIRTVAVTRIVFPTSKVRLSAGRENMSEEMQAWCFMAGANSIHVGEKLLTAKNPTTSDDFKLLEKLNLKIKKSPATEHEKSNSSI